MHTKKVSVVIPHFNDLKGLDRCLQTLTQQTYPAELTEIIVSDNNSPQGLEAVANCVAGRAKLVLCEERGAGPARNRGVAASTSPYLAFIDSDCIAEPQWLEAGLAALDKFDFVGGPVNVIVDHDDPLSPAEAFELVFGFDNESYIRTKGFTGSGNLFTQRKIFDDVGGFRVGMSEDLEWSHRARSKGYTLGYSKTATIAHPARSNWEELRRKWLRIQSETYALKTPSFPNKLRWLARTWAMPASILAHTPKVLRSDQLHNSQHRRSALLGLAQIRLWRFMDGHRLAFGMRRS